MRWTMSGGIRSMLGAAEPPKAPLMTWRMRVAVAALAVDHHQRVIGADAAQARADSEKLAMSVPCVWAWNEGTSWVSAWLRLGWPTRVERLLATGAGSARRRRRRCMPAARVPVTMISSPPDVASAVCTSVVSAGRFGLR